MNTNDFRIEFYKKLNEEQKRYREWLLIQEPEEILNHTCEYTVREDIVMSLENLELTEEEAEMLLSLPSLLDDLYKDYKKMETGSIDIIQSCLNHRIASFRKRQQ